MKKHPYTSDTAEEQANGWINPKGWGGGGRGKDIVSLEMFSMNIIAWYAIKFQF